MFEIKIIVNREGQVLVHGPLQYKMAVLGALELAKDAVLRGEPTEGPSLVLPGGRLPQLRNGG